MNFASLTKFCMQTIKIGNNSNYVVSPVIWLIFVRQVVKAKFNCVVLAEKRLERSHSTNFVRVVVLGSNYYRVQGYGHRKNETIIVVSMFTD